MIFLHGRTIFINKKKHNEKVFYYPGCACNNSHDDVS